VERHAGQIHATRIIFKDFETSNWAWDPVAKAYYWHRFYSHQPDLNFDNPAVHEAVEKVCDFWLDMGVDGLRLDAVPYLYEREGTSCENLRETHEYLQETPRPRRFEIPGPHAPAEANQWPEDAVEYFGDGNESHMNFHFPLMPRMFMSLQMEDRFPIIDIMDQTPAIPENCQWAMFLRNHDELTLEMVTDEERDYMWRVYANDPTARINLGIRRRLAPLLANSRRKIELLNILLFSMPGTPGHLLRRRDRHGRQRLPRRSQRRPHADAMERRSNAGFSRANPQQLCCPIIIDPEYNYEGDQRREPAEEPLVAALVDAPRHRDAQELQGVLARQARVPLPGKREGLAFSAVRRRDCARRRLSVALLASRGARSLTLLRVRRSWKFSCKTIFLRSKTRPTSSQLGPATIFWFVVARSPESAARTEEREIPTLHCRAASPRCCRGSNARSSNARSCRDMWADRPLVCLKGAQQ
jgi:hypothetical protein